MYHFFALISRMTYINRWGLMHNTFPENVAEHSLMTAVLAHGLAIIRRDIFKKEADPERCAAAALFHDAPEIFTGDMPTPVKYWSNDIRNAYKEIELHSADKLLSFLPPELKPSYKQVLSDGEEELIKAADKLAAYLKSTAEVKAGNRDFDSALNQTLEKLTQMKLPEIDYFLENFYQSFTLTLDQLW